LKNITEALAKAGFTVHGVPVYLKWSRVFVIYGRRKTRNLFK
jgi:hypothetical protein